MNNKLCFLLIIFYSLYNLVQSITFQIDKGHKKCFYLQLDSEKIMEVKFRIRFNKLQVHKCQILMEIRSRGEISEDTEQVYQKIQFSKSFYCPVRTGVNMVQQDFFLQKFTVQDEIGLTKYQICFANLQSYLPVSVQTLINQKINPLYDDTHSNQQLSLVTSRQLKDVQSIVNKLSHQLVSLEKIQSSFMESEEELNNHNIKLKSRIKKVTILQIIAVIGLGTIWVWVLKNARV